MTARLAQLISFAVLVWGAAFGAQADPYQVPRTSFGAPDLEGIWTNQTATPLERSPAYKGLVATDAEMQARRLRRAAAPASAPQASTPKSAGPAAAADGDVGQEQSEFGDADAGLMLIDGRRRTSVITDPADGRLPYTVEGRRLATAAAAPDAHGFDGPEDRSASERCLAAPNGQSGPPMLSGPDDANFQIVETRDRVGVLSEMIHDMRIVRLGGTHPAARTHPLMGDAIGRWDGDTLVIETVDQSPLTTARDVGGAVFWLSPDAKVVERLRRISPKEILYDFTVEDPRIYTRPWSGQMVLRRIDKPIYEYACHEGNYALANVLSGARAKDAAAPGPGQPH